jgi:hypothetical protein
MNCDGMGWEASARVLLTSNFTTNCMSDSSTRTGLCRTRSSLYQLAIINLCIHTTSNLQPAAFLYNKPTASFAPRLNRLTPCEHICFPRQVRGPEIPTVNCCWHELPRTPDQIRCLQCAKL